MAQHGQEKHEPCIKLYLIIFILHMSFPKSLCLYHQSLFKVSPFAHNTLSRATATISSKLIGALMSVVTK